MEKIPYHSIAGLTFSVYQRSDFEKLSVLEVTNVETFDALGHPTLKGLYDSSLGSNGRDELCGTCGLNQTMCPGHFAHITLPLPIFNPVFFRNLYQLLKGSCFDCHHLLAPASSSYLLLAQLRVLEYGFVRAVDELESLLSEAATKKAKNAVQLSSNVKDRLEEYVNCLLQGQDKKDAISVRNVTECRQRITRRFLQSHLSRASRKCPHCGATNKSLAVYQNSRLIFGTAGQKHSSSHLNTDDGKLSHAEDDERATQSYLTPLEARKYILELWDQEKSILTELFGIFKTASPVDIFFLDAVFVPPSRFRPISFMKGKKYENPQTTALNQLLIATAQLANLIKSMKDPEKQSQEKPKDNKASEQLHMSWNKLQVLVNCLIDSDLDKLNTDKLPGIKQVIEKKEGIFRKNMMGKRVNFAARSVISPDPYIMVDEVGIPQVFATRLTYPQPVTPWNVQELRRAVQNGPNIHPGAALVEDEDGTIIRLLPGNRVQREAIAKLLLTPGAVPGGCKIVHRHIKNGDVVLMNRQPTLHRPSIMAHKVRVLSGEKTLRLHYANCKCYNADFDGDEMNCHFPQSELARAEAYSLANVGSQYLVPKDGTPLGGLIQDHVVAGTALTMRGQFFSREEYQQLVYGSLTFCTRAIRLFPPCILRPCALWSGKQVVSTVIINLMPEGKPFPSLEGKAKIDAKHFVNITPRCYKAGGSNLSDNEMCESWVVFRCGELLCGVVDKAHIGPTPYGFIHCCYELYGGDTSSVLLTAFARLFTHFLQLHKGFTLGVEDILVTEKANRKRTRIVSESPCLGVEGYCEAFGVTSKELLPRMQEAHCSRDDRLLKQLDSVMKTKTDSINNHINKTCMPKGLWKPFPQNNLQLMVQSGAKGATVNCMQISCLLGQIELEGRRVPLMMSGKTLPSFRTHDTTPRAGGFVSGRFLTGIRPQEFFFHCMAGREGLVDTAVKTSRSGYLQRCLVKHLEGLVVNYDLTVRDSDGSVMQFQYGEDGLDINRHQLLTPSQFPLILANHQAMANSQELDQIMQMGSEHVRHARKKILKWQLKNEQQNTGKSYNSAFMQFANSSLDAVRVICPDTAEAKKVLQETWFDLEPRQRKRFNRLSKKRPDPITGELRPDLHFGAVSEMLDCLIDNYLEAHPSTPEIFRQIIYYKALTALCQPGEAVGLLAAQSIGEPSTQMTLNTFHFAGRGEMNVTLGIPRLREILMTASGKIGTPSMDLPLILGADAQKLRRRLTAVCLAEVLQEVHVNDMLVVQRQRRFRKYNVKFVFLPRKAYKKQFSIRPAHILQFVEQTFLRKLCVALKKKLSMLATSRSLKTISRRKETASEEKETLPPVVDDSSEDEGGDGDTTATGQKRKHDQEQEYEEPEEEELIPEAEDEGFEEEPSLEGKEDDMAEDEKEFYLREPSSQHQQRVSSVLAINHWISEYEFDLVKESWCQVTLQLPLTGSKLDVTSLVEEEARRALFHQTSGIRRAFVVKDTKGKEMIKTEGVNFLEIFSLQKFVDLSRVYSNDIHAIARTYGIEAAARAIVREVTGVFAAYGIRIDPRHLLLVADYMTFDGTFKGCNRMAIENNASPLQKMTFETTMNFLRSATLLGSKEELRSPSARLVVGQVVSCGTGTFELLQKRTF